MTAKETLLKVAEKYPNFGLLTGTMPVITEAIREYAFQLIKESSISQRDHQKEIYRANPLSVFCIHNTDEAYHKGIEIGIFGLLKILQDEIEKEIPVLPEIEEFCKCRTSNDKFENGFLVCQVCDKRVLARIM